MQILHVMIARLIEKYDLYFNFLSDTCIVSLEHNISSIHAKQMIRFCYSGFRNYYHWIYLYIILTVPKPPFVCFVNVGTLPMVLQQSCLKWTPVTACLWTCWHEEQCPTSFCLFLGINISLVDDFHTVEGCFPTFPYNWVRLLRCQPQR